MYILHILQCKKIPKFKNRKNFLHISRWAYIYIHVCIYNFSVYMFVCVCLRVCVCVMCVCVVVSVLRKMDEIRILLMRVIKSYRIIAIHLHMVHNEDLLKRGRRKG